MITAVILAAGRGQRMGLPKALALLDGRPFLEVVAEVCARGGCGRILAVHAPDAPEVARLAERLGLEPVVNPDPSRGMFSSVVVGLAAALESDPPLGRPGKKLSLRPLPRQAGSGPGDHRGISRICLGSPEPDPAPNRHRELATHFCRSVLDGVVVFPVDHPRVADATVVRVVSELSAVPPTAWVQPVCDGRGGHPVGLGAACARAVAAEDPRSTLRDALAKAGDPTGVPVADPHVLTNINYRWQL